MCIFLHISKYNHTMRLWLILWYIFPEFLSYRPEIDLFSTPKNRFYAAENYFLVRRHEIVFCNLIEEIPNIRVYFSETDKPTNKFLGGIVHSWRIPEKAESCFCSLPRQVLTEAFQSFILIPLESFHPWAW